MFTTKICVKPIYCQMGSHGLVYKREKKTDMFHFVPSTYKPDQHIETGANGGEEGGKARQVEWSCLDDLRVQVEGSSSDHHTKGAPSVNDDIGW